MPVLDQTILSQVQRVTLEGVGDGGATWPSGMWTLAEVLGYLNQRQNRFLAATGLMWKRTAALLTIGQRDQPAPIDWIATIFIAYHSSLLDYSELPKVDVFELDRALPGWPYLACDVPKGYYEIDGSTLTTYVVPCPLDVGCGVERYYVALGTVLDATGVLFSVPDEFVPTIKYGALAEMFGKVGQAGNPALAQACEERWQEGVELGALMATEGWFLL